MRSLEVGRQAAKYTFNTAKEISGIGRAQRAYKQELSTGHVESVLYGAVNGLVSVAAPLAMKSVENGKGIFPGFLIDIPVNALALSFLRAGDIQAAFITKIGYNVLVQLAPDVAKLAKGRFFQRAK
ncbi:MAG: hypothetical protein HYW62_00585 [Candidatus Levybacteria bacterium]|nr:hypothetical protein [Candidatus Levybacteria bacterium]